MLKRAMGLGSIGIFAYIANYYLRNLLSVATPNMLKSGEYTPEFIGFLSSVYFIVYASGQLVNGLVGDMINPKHMIFIGLTVTGTVVAAFPSIPFAWVKVACFALMGSRSFHATRSNYENGFRKCKQGLFKSDLYLLIGGILCGDADCKLLCDSV